MLLGIENRSYQDSYQDAVRERLNEQQRQIDYLATKLRDLAAQQAEMANNMVAQGSIVAQALGVKL